MEGGGGLDNIFEFLLESDKVILKWFNPIQDSWK